MGLPVSQATAQALVFTSLPDGNLILVKVGSGETQSIDALLIKSSAMSFNAQQQFYEYEIRSQNGEEEPYIVSDKDNSCSDSSRRLILNLQGYASAENLKQRLTSEIAQCSSPRYTLNCAGWQQDGVLWDINTPVQLDYQGVKGDLLLSELTIKASNKQQQSRTTCSRHARRDFSTVR